MVGRSSLGGTGSLGNASCKRRQHNTVALGGGNRTVLKPIFFVRSVTERFGLRGSTSAQHNDFRRFAVFPERGRQFPPVGRHNADWALDNERAVRFRGYRDESHAANIALRNGLIQERVLLRASCPAARSSSSASPSRRVSLNVGHSPIAWLIHRRAISRVPRANPLAGNRGDGKRSRWPPGSIVPSSSTSAATCAAGAPRPTARSTPIRKSARSSTRSSFRFG